MDSRPTPDFAALIAALAHELDARRIPFMVIGGQAVLLLHKLFAGRPRDIEDAAGVVRRKGAELDWEYLARWAREFASIPGREDLPDQLAALRDAGAA